MARMSDEKFEEFLRQSNDYLRIRVEESKAEFKLGSYERFDWDQWRGELVFSSKGVPKVVAQIQFVGSISTQSNTWLWAWANPSYLEPVRSGSLRIKEFGKEHGISKLQDAKWSAEEVDGWEMTAIAARLLEAKGAYRSPGETGFSFMVFTDIQAVSDRKRVFATLTCSHVLDDGRPILYVHKETDGDVQLLCGGVHKTAKTARIIHLDHLLDMDESLKELADLPIGWFAERKQRGAPWIRSKE